MFDPEQLCTQCIASASQRHAMCGGRICPTDACAQIVTQRCGQSRLLIDGEYAEEEAVDACLQAVHLHVYPTALGRRIGVSQTHIVAHRQQVSKRLHGLGVKPVLILGNLWQVDAGQGERDACSCRLQCGLPGHHELWQGALGCIACRVGFALIRQCVPPGRGMSALCPGMTAI